MLRLSYNIHLFLFCMAQLSTEVSQIQQALACFLSAIFLACSMPFDCLGESILFPTMANAKTYSALARVCVSIPSIVPLLLSPLALPSPTFSKTFRWWAKSQA